MLDPTWTLADALTDGKGDTVTIGTQTKHVIGYMKDFLFAPEQARTPVSVLSGGERARVVLARSLAKASNVLVLDEPTNDLDLETLDVLEELLADYSGTVLLVSHDRDFLDRVVTSTITAEGGGKWQEYAGGYTDMIAQRGVGVEARKASEGKRLEQTRQPTSAEPAPKAKVKLSFKDKHALETLPSRIEQLEGEIAKLQKELDDPTLYSKNRARFTELTDTITAKRHEQEHAEEELLRLMILAEG